MYVYNYKGLWFCLVKVVKVRTFVIKNVLNCKSNNAPNLNYKLAEIYEFYYYEPYYYISLHYICVNVVFCFRLWQHVTSAINTKDQNKATQEKFVLEEAQRQEARQRGDQPWNPHYFSLNPITNEWNYKYMEYVPTSPISTHKATALIRKNYFIELYYFIIYFVSCPVFMFFLSALKCGILTAAWFNLRKTASSRPKKSPGVSTMALPTARTGTASRRSEGFHAF